MSILARADTKVLCQGLTGRAATFHMGKAVAYGTQLVGGVRPGKGGTSHLDVPVFDRVHEGMTATGATASMVFVPAEDAAVALIEGIEAELDLMICVSERIPVLDMIRVKAALAGSKTRLVGPNSQGVLIPGACKLGVMATLDARPGSVGIASRSASLASEVVAQTSTVGLGQSTTVGVGGDPIHGVGFVDCLEMFFADDETDRIVLIGEIGGREEEAAAAYLADRGCLKPVYAVVAGRRAPPAQRMGHAGTLTAVGSGGGNTKAAVLEAAGVHVIRDVSCVGATLAAPGLRPDL